MSWIPDGATSQLHQLLPHRTARAISARLGALGLRSGRYTFDKDYFCTPTHQNAYWAGLLAADADIQETRDYLSLKLKETDNELIRRFARDTGFSGQLYYYTQHDKRTGNTYESAQIRVYGCKSWISDLRRLWNITGRKSLTLKPPELPDVAPYLLSFLVGFIDGDGSIQALVDSKDRHYLRLQLSGTKEFLDWAKRIFDNLVPNTHWQESNVRRNGNMYDLIITGRRAVLITQILHQQPVTKLARKWDRVPLSAQKPNDILPLRLFD